MSEGGFVLDTPEQIEIYRLLAIQKALKLEVEHGLIMTKGNQALWRAEEVLELYERLPEGRLTKKKALRLITTLLEDLMPLDRGESNE